MSNFLLIVVINFVFFKIFYLFIYFLILHFILFLNFT